MLFKWFGLDKKTTEERLDKIEIHLGGLLDSHIVENKLKIEELERRVRQIEDYLIRKVEPLQEFLDYEVKIESKDDPAYLPPPPNPKIKVYKFIKRKK